MSSILFNIALESVGPKVPRTESMRLSDGNILLAYADDIVIIGKTQEKLKKYMMEIMNTG